MEGSKAAAVRVRPKAQALAGLQSDRPVPEKEEKETVLGKNEMEGGICMGV